MDTFLDRLNWLAHGRKLTPWLTAIGWPGSTISGLHKGGMPNADKLADLALAESCSITWLLTGCGAPYTVLLELNELGAAQTMSQIRQKHGGDPLMIEGKASTAILLHGLYTLPGSGRPSLIYHVIGGPFKATPRLDIPLYGAIKRKLPDPVVNEIIQGHMGPWTVMQLPDLFLKESARTGVSEPPARYEPGEMVLHATSELLMRVMRLPAEDQHFVSTILDRLRSDKNP